MLLFLGAVILYWSYVNLKTLFSHFTSVFSSVVLITMLLPRIDLGQGICGKLKFPIF